MTLDESFETPLPQMTREPRGPQIMPVLGGPVRTGRPNSPLGDPSAGLLDSVVLTNDALGAEQLDVLGSK